MRLRYLVVWHVDSIQRSTAPIEPTIVALPVDPPSAVALQLTQIPLPSDTGRRRPYPAWTNDRPPRLCRWPPEYGRECALLRWLSDSRAIDGCRSVRQPP